MPNADNLVAENANSAGPHSFFGRIRYDVVLLSYKQHLLSNLDIEGMNIN